MIEIETESTIQKSLIIIEASNAMMMEQRILDAMTDGYMMHGNVGMSPKGVYFVIMIKGKKTIRTGV